MFGCIWDECNHEMDGANGELCPDWIQDPDFLSLEWMSL